MNRIGLFLGVCRGTILNWIRELGKDWCPKPKPDPQTKVIVVEVDEFWHYIKKKLNAVGSSRLMIVTVNDSLTGSL